MIYESRPTKQTESKVINNDKGASIFFQEGERERFIQLFDNKIPACNKESLTKLMKDRINESKKINKNIDFIENVTQIEESYKLKSNILSNKKLIDYEMPYC